MTASELYNIPEKDVALFVPGVIFDLIKTYNKDVADKFQGNKEKYLVTTLQTQANPYDNPGGLVYYIHIFKIKK